MKESSKGNIRLHSHKVTTGLASICMLEHWHYMDE